MDVTNIDNPQRAIEVRVLATAKQSREFLADSVAWLETYQWTSDDLTWVWDRYKSFNDKGELPSVTTMVGMVRMEQVKKQEALSNLLREVYASDISQSLKTDCEFLMRCFKHDIVIGGIEGANNRLEKGDLDGAVQIMDKAANETKSSVSPIRSASLVDWDDWFKGPETVRGIPTGIQSLDDELQGGGTKGELCLIMGNTNMGKSILAVNFGHAGVKHGYRVLHIDSENGEDTTRWRYIARFCGKPTKSLQRRRLQAEMEGWARANKERLDNHLRILNIGISCTFFADVQKEVAKLRRQGFVPDEIVFDSPDHMAMSGESDNLASYNKILYEKLKGWASPKGVDVFLVAVIQAQAASEGKIVTSKNAAWGYDKARIADTIVTIGPPLNDRGQPVGELKMGNDRSLFVAKARSAGSRFLIKLKTDLPIAKIVQKSEQESDERNAS